MIGSGAAVPGYSAHDQALTMLKVAADAKGTRERLDALHKAAKAHDEAKREVHEKIHLHDEYARGLDKRTEALDAREAQLKAREAEFEKFKAGIESGHESRANSLAEREQVFEHGKKELAGKIEEFSRYREREIAAIQAKAAQANKLHESAEANHKEADRHRAELEARVARIHAWKAKLSEEAKGL